MKRMSVTLDTSVVETSKNKSRYMFLELYLEIAL
jgi:hypothetical protein